MTKIENWPRYPTKYDTEEFRHGTLLPFVFEIDHGGSKYVSHSDGVIYHMSPRGWVKVKDRD